MDAFFRRTRGVLVDVSNQTPDDLDALLRVTPPRDVLLVSKEKSFNYKTRQDDPMPWQRGLHWLVVGVPHAGADGPVRAVFDQTRQRFVKRPTTSPHISYEPASKCRVRDGVTRRSLSKHATHRACEIDDVVLWKLHKTHGWPVVTHDRGLRESLPRTRAPALPKEVDRVLPFVTLVLLTWDGHRWKEAMREA